MNLFLQSYFHVELFSHCFVLTKVSPRGRQIVSQFSEQYIQYGLVKEGRFFKQAPLRRFAARVQGGYEYRFHIEQWLPFQLYLANMQILPHTYTVGEAPTKFKNKTADIHTLPKWEIRDYQEPIIEYLVDPGQKRKMVEIQTGRGKTFSAMKAACLIGLRLGIVLKPAFMDKWVSDVFELCGLKKDRELTVIQGTPQLLKVLQLAKKGKYKSDCLIISSRTLQQWYKTYEELGPEACRRKGYACDPGDFFEFLGIGTRIIDEVHLDFALHFKIDMYTNVEWSISLSATLTADDPFQNRMYELAYPKDKRFAGLPYDKYIHSYAWMYEIRDPRPIRTTEWGSTSYSHHAFEKSIRRNIVLQEDFFQMVNTIMRELYLVGHKRGERCLIYTASVELASLLTSYLRNIHPSFDIRRYVEDDPYENLMEAEISVSTLQSAGTGHDIAGLTTVILTNSVKSSQSNIQGFGRLRKIDGREVKFAYLVCTNIAKQVAYHDHKRDILMAKAKTYSLRHYSKELG